MADSKFEIVDGVLKKYTGTDKEVIIPEGVIALSDRCFIEAHFMEVVTFPSTLKKVGSGIVATDYYGYEYNLKRVNVNSLDTWMDIEFDDDKGNLLGVNDEVELYVDNKLVTDLVVPGKFKVVKPYTFFGYKKLRSVTFEEGVETIYPGSFARSGVEDVKLPNSVTNLTARVVYSFFTSPFMGCSSLKQINIPKGIKELPASFLSSTSIEKIDLPDQLEIIPDRCFAYCKSLKSVKIPNGVKRVGANAFFKCDSLNELIFPDSVHYIGTISLENLEKIILPEEWTFVGHQSMLLFDYPILEKLKMNEYDNALYVGSRTNPYQVLVRAKSKDVSNCNIHKDCKYICGCGSYSRGESGFYECKNIKSLFLPEGIKRIEYGALAKCDSLETVDVPVEFGELDPNVYIDSKKLKFKDFGVKDKVFKLEKVAEIDGELIKEEISVSANGINLLSTITLENKEVITTRFDKKNPVSKERLIYIFSLLNKEQELTEDDYLNNLDVYKITFPVNNNEYVTRYILLSDNLIRITYSLFYNFIGEYFLINPHYKEQHLSASENSNFNIEEFRNAIEERYKHYKLEELGELLSKAKNSGDYIEYEKIILYINKIKNNGAWERIFYEE